MPIIQEKSNCNLAIQEKSKCILANYEREKMYSCHVGKEQVYAYHTGNEQLQSCHSGKERATYNSSSLGSLRPIARPFESRMSCGDGGPLFGLLTAEIIRMPWESSDSAFWPPL